MTSGISATWAMNQLPPFLEHDDSGFKQFMTWHPKWSVDGSHHLEDGQLVNLEDDMSADASPCDGQCRFDIMPGKKREETLNPWINQRHPY